VRCCPGAPVLHRHPALGRTARVDRVRRATSLSRRVDGDSRRPALPWGRRRGVRPRRKRTGQLARARRRRLFAAHSSTCSWPWRGGALLPPISLRRPRLSAPLSPASPLTAHLVCGAVCIDPPPLDAALDSALDAPQRRSARATAPPCSARSLDSAQLAVGGARRRAGAERAGDPASCGS